MVDSYTKIVLGVIAFSLVIIAARGIVMTPANATGDALCGRISNPCYVQITTGQFQTSIPVEVKNVVRVMGY
jgi:hypothetical protein